MAVDSLTQPVVVMALYSQVALRTGDCQTQWSSAVLVQLGDKLHGWPERVGKGLQRSAKRLNGERP